MKDTNKEDVIFALKRLENYIESMNDIEFKKILSGERITTAFMTYDWNIYSTLEPEYSRQINHLEVRLR